MKKNKLSDIIIIIGPTASGKSDMAVSIAKKIKSEIVSSDSRQIYKYLDIGSGKITKKEMKDIIHHCLDIFDPGQNRSVTEYLKEAEKAIKDIIERGMTPIICGGTGLYIDAILYGLPKNPKPNPEFRKELEKKSNQELLEEIKSLNKEKYNSLINNQNPSERNNNRRLIRLIEILKFSENSSQKPLSKKLKYNPQFIFIEREKEELRERINKRIQNRLNAKGKNNLINEIKFLLNDLKVDKDWLESLGLEYKYVTMYVENKISLEDMIRELENKTWQYAKRQILWNKRYLNFKK